MKLEVGKQYRCRDGSGPVEISKYKKNELYCMFGNIGCYTINGEYYQGEDSPLDLVAEWAEPEQVAHIKPKGNDAWGRPQYDITLIGKTVLLKNNETRKVVDFRTDCHPNIMVDKPVNFSNSLCFMVHSVNYVSWTDILKVLPEQGGVKLVPLDEYTLPEHLKRKPTANPDWYLGFWEKVFIQTINGPVDPKEVDWCVQIAAKLADAACAERMKREGI